MSGKVKDLLGLSIWDLPSVLGCLKQAYNMLLIPSMSHTYKAYDTSLIATHYKFKSVFPLS